MKFLIAKTAGFCFGVNRAIKMAHETIYNSNGKKVYCIGPIIHNELVVADLEDRGITFVKTHKDVDNCSIAIIESHGVGAQVLSELNDKNVTVVNATCPYVAKIHSIVSKHYKDDYEIIIVGNPNHPEVIGINGWCENNAIIINKIEQLSNIDLAGKKICVVSQTTNEFDNWNTIKNAIKSKYPNTVIFDTICNATNERQKEAKEIAKKVDAMLVIGSKSSSNTCNLYNICSKLCPKTFHVQNVDEIDYDQIKNCNLIGVTAGASAPDWLIKSVMDAISKADDM